MRTIYLPDEQVLCFVTFARPIHICIADSLFDRNQCFVQFLSINIALPLKTKSSSSSKTPWPNAFPGYLKNSKAPCIPGYRKTPRRHAFQGIIKSISMGSQWPRRQTSQTLATMPNDLIPDSPVRHNMLEKK